ncbi:secretory calcium-binding phosphoprotein 1 [Siniperca chuatsi]|uniref:secretory calcium-binding phosphoprotein 1 n=1 Tax=Siniperca chuatsi TaxID=119488 RepID=UPI001CE1446E|nr:secretory calcium-binding phosphoprotein 1 [Siniperca chuatsi]
MKVTIITFCLIGAVFANPISFNAVLESSELDPNTTESLSVSQSSENDTSELQSSEENTSSQSQSSESESLETTSEDKTSEESNSQSDEDDGTDFAAETRDNSMGSEENVRKSWVRVFASVIKVLSAEDNSSTEVKGQSDHLTAKQPTHTSTSDTFRQRTNTTQGHTNLPLVENPTHSSDTTSDSADTSDITGVTAVTSNSSESTSSESNETNESSENSDSSDASKSSEESNASDSSELEQVKTQDCVNGTQSCESEEYIFQDIGDDAHSSVDNLMVPDEDERELSLRR